MLDITKLGQDETAELELLHPVSGALTGAFITLYGKDSKFYREYLTKRKQTQLSKALKKGRATMTAADLDEQSLNMIVAMTKSWREIGMGGKALECTPETIKKLYSDTPWIKEQVDEAIHSRELFIKG